MCGIIAWSGSSPKKFNKQKFDILGLFNNSRGGDSVGVSTDGEIYYGVHLNKNYDDFIINKGYIPPVKVAAAIGHMRKASVGTISETNAHPFGFGTLNEGFEFIGCHNGTLSNYDELGRDYGITTSIYNDRNVFMRNKVDSEILLEILYTTRNTTVLEDYIGGAALVFQDLTTPTKIYAFHGASKKEVGDKDETLWEERPLYYYQESKDSVYISSMEEALIFIGGVKDETVFEFHHNQLYEIENGNVAKSIRHKIDRTGAGQRKSYQGGFVAGGKATTTATNAYDRSLHSKKAAKKERSKRGRMKKLENVSNIYNETVIEGDFKSAIYYNKLRYWRNGHTIDGIYTYVKGWGFFKLGIVAAETNEKIYRLLGAYFSFETGEFVNDKDVDYRLKIDPTMFVPFDYALKEPPLFYFYEGIMLETVHDYIVLSSDYKTQFSFEHLSQMAKYPICKVAKHSPPDTRQGILYNGKPYTDNFVPLQCHNMYVVEEGNLVCIERFEEDVQKEAETCCAFNNPLSMDGTIQLPLKFEVPELVTNPNLAPKPQISGVADFLNKPTVEFLDEDPPIDTYVSASDSDKDFEIINKYVMPIYEHMQVCNENLKNEDSDVIQEIVELQKDYLISIDCIIESKEK